MWVINSCCAAPVFWFPVYCQEVARLRQWIAELESETPDRTTALFLLLLSSWPLAFRCLVSVGVVLLVDKSLHECVEHYTEITPTLYAKKRDTVATPKLAASRSAAANFCLPHVSRFCTHFWRHFGISFNQIVQ